MQSAAYAADQTYQFDIPSEPLDRALTDFSQASSQQLIFSADLVRGRTAAGLHGRYTAVEALNALLLGTDLVAQVNPSGVLMVQSKNADAPSIEGASNAQSNSSIEVVVVTAERRAQKLQDVPASVVALTSADLAKQKINDIDDLALAVPSLGMQTGGYWRRVVIRGVSNFFGSSQPNVGVYLDEADITGRDRYQLDTGTYDLQRVEVLRGPQGTLYGEGSVGGAIHFIANNPVFDQFQFGANVDALVTQGGRPGEHIQSMLNIPLVDDQLALRAVGEFQHTGGWISDPTANASDYNGADKADVRIKVLWQPDDALTVSAMALVFRSSGGLSYGEDSHDNFVQPWGIAATPNQKNDYDLFNLTLTYDLPGVRLLSTTSYLDTSQTFLNLGILLQLTAPPSAPYGYFQPYLHNSSDELVQELRLSSQDSGPWEWVVGAYYKYSVGPNNPTAALYFGPNNLPMPTAAAATYTAGCCGLDRSAAAYADTNYKLWDSLTVGAGIRYYIDIQHNGLGATNFGSPPTTLSPFPNGNFYSLDPRFYLDYALSDHLNLYASAAKGFRSGGVNAFNQPHFGPETVWSYETGAKGTFLDGRLSVDGALFYTNYFNMQLNGILPPPNPPQEYIRNGGDARIDGLEWDVSWQPADHWIFGLNGSYLIDDRFTALKVQNSGYDVGDSIDGTPKYNFNASVERDFSIAGKDGFARLEYAQQGPSTYRQREIGPWFFASSNVIHMLNFSSNLKWTDNLSLGVFGQNLLDDRGLSSPESLKPTPCAQAPVCLNENDLEFRPVPRTFGVQFAVEY